jgi:hypothetical protein
MLEDVTPLRLAISNRPRGDPRIENHKAPDPPPGRDSDLLYGIQFFPRDKILSHRKLVGSLHILRRGSFQLIEMRPLSPLSSLKKEKVLYL